MADRPILFSAPMVLALLDGRKTQTRRLLSLRGHKSFSEFGVSTTQGYDWHFRDAEMRWHDFRNSELLKRMKHAVGDRLWVREAWRTQECFDDESPKAIVGQFRKEFGEDSIPTFYEADKKCDDHSIELWQQGPLGRLRSSMHMPRCASRFTLTVTNVRVERLQDVSEADAVAEGVIKVRDSCHVIKGFDYDNHGLCHTSPITPYAKLWDQIHAPGSWDKNPWIVAYSFTVERRNIDEAGQ